MIGVVVHHQVDARGRSGLGQELEFFDRTRVITVRIVRSEDQLEMLAQPHGFVELMERWGCRIQIRVDDSADAA